MKTIKLILAWTAATLPLQLLLVGALFASDEETARVCLEGLCLIFLVGITSVGIVWLINHHLYGP